MQKQRKLLPMLCSSSIEDHHKAEEVRNFDHPNYNCIIFHFMGDQLENFPGYCSSDGSVSGHGYISIPLEKKWDLW